MVRENQGGYGARDRGPKEFSSREVETEGSVLEITREVVDVPPTMTIKGLAETVSEYEERRVPVTDPGTREIIGLVKSRDMINFLGGGEMFNIVTQDHDGNLLSAIHEPIRKIMHHDIISANYRDHIMDAFKKTMDNDVGGLPVLKNKIPQGVVEEKEFVEFFASQDVGAKVKEAMTTDLITATPRMTLGDIGKEMIRNDVRRLPVIDHDEMVGIITTIDILDFFGNNGIFEKAKSTMAEDILNIRANEFMTEGLITVEQEADVGKAAEIMKEKQIGSLMVINEEVEGIITRRDILRFVDTE